MCGGVGIIVPMTQLTEIRSIHWQPALGQHGDVVEGVADIEQAIHIILKTPKGSDPHRPDFGSNVHRYIDWPVTRAIPHLVRESVEAIRKWEPRCELVKVEPRIDGAQIIQRVLWRLADGMVRETAVAL